MTSLTIVPGPRPSATARDRDISVGEHAHQFAFLSDRHHAGVDVCHDAGSVLNGLFRIRDAHIARHDFTDFHRSDSFSLNVPDAAWSRSTVRVLLVSLAGRSRLLGGGITLCL